MADDVERVAPTLRSAIQAPRIVGYWVACLGAKRLSEIRTSRSRHCRLQRARKPRIPGAKREIKPATINREIAVLERMLNIARAWGLVEGNPVTRLRTPGMWPPGGPGGCTRASKPDMVHCSSMACPFREGPVTDPEVVRSILTCIGPPARRPPIPPTREREQAEQGFEG